ncbi:MAG: 4Fe-4S binding protein [Clostridia bacterium]|nr:4Fe-4S binding protein [Clostridia bacterium]
MAEKCITLNINKCKNCHRCLMYCPVKAIRYSSGQAQIIDDECILCGLCYNHCPQDAKVVKDGLTLVKRWIADGEKVVASLAPSYIAAFNGAGIAEMKSELCKLGFYDVVETAEAATAVTKEYERLMTEEKQDVIISTCCHSVNLLVQKYYPDLIKKLAHTKSPMQVSCQRIKENIPDAKTVFIGPCIAKIDEAKTYEGIVDAVITFEDIVKWFETENIVLDNSSADLGGKTRLYPISGGILKTFSEKHPEYTYFAVDGVKKCKAALDEISKGNIHNCFIEMSACTNSCIGGPILRKYHHTPILDRLTIERSASEEDYDFAQPEKDSLSKDFTWLQKSAHQPSSREIQQILNDMGKKKPADELNCGSCGYATCRDKAIAVYQGKAEITMCLPYLKNRAEDISSMLFNNSPNGIILINDDFVITAINKSALEIFGDPSPSAMIGKSIIYYMDAQPFMQLITTGTRPDPQRIYLSEYGKYVEQRFVYDKNYHQIMLILIDVTEDETQKRKHEKIVSQTLALADEVSKKQMKTVQEIALLLGETAAETKIAITNLQESLKDE